MSYLSAEPFCMQAMYMVTSIFLGEALAGYCTKRVVRNALKPSIHIVRYCELLQARPNTDGCSMLRTSFLTVASQNLRDPLPAFIKNFLLASTCTPASSRDVASMLSSASSAQCNSKWMPCSILSSWIQYDCDKQLGA